MAAFEPTMPFKPVLLWCSVSCYANLFVLLLEFRVENLRKFKSDGDDCPTLVCTDLAARGLDLDVDHVVMFDFPLNSVSIISINLFSGLLGH